MAIKMNFGKLTDFFKKYKFVVLILVVGLGMMLIPTDDNGKESETNLTTQPSIQVTEEEKLSNILSQIKGAGRVEVMLTILTGEETLYQSDDNDNSGDTTYSKNSDTVIVTDAQRNQNGLVRQVNPPVYLGAVVVCQGADDSAVKLAIVDAVSKLTGLGANRISVLKMK